MYPGDDSKIEAAKLTLFPKDKRVEAEGKVRSVTASQEVTADQLVFTDSGQGPQVAYYKGNVSVSGDFARPKTDKQAADKKVHMSLRSNDLEVHSSDGNLGRIIATGGVQMFQGKQSGRGTFMEYDVTSGAVLLKGTSASPAELSDEDRSFRGCSVQIDADGTRKATNCENGRVTTSINQK